MKINLNMSSVIANNQLRRTENKLQASMERLSSGLKINRPGDNPAGMAISNKMKEQIDALKQAEDNAGDGVSIIQVADGALNEVSNMLQRIRELSVQAANDIYAYDDKRTIQDEIDQLKLEVDRISTDTEFNTKILLDGSSDIRVYSETYDNSGNVTRYTEDISRMYVSDEVKAGEYDFTVVASGTAASNGFDISFVNGISDSDKLSDAGLITEEYISINGAKMEVTPDMTKRDFLDGLRTIGKEGYVDMYFNPAGNDVTVESQQCGTDSELEIRMSAGLGAIMSNSGTNLTRYQASKDATGAWVNEDVLCQDGTVGKSDYTIDPDTGEYVGKSEGTNAIVNILGKGETGASGTIWEDSLFTENARYSTDGNKVYIQDNDGFSMEFLISAKQITSDQPKDISMDVTDIGQMVMQIGANQDQTMKVRIPEVSSKSLYIDTVCVTTTSEAGKSISICEKAISRLSEIRSRLGAYQNRLEYSQTSLAETHEDMTTAYSRLLDTDMAEEMVNYANLNILDQAGISVLSQANDLPQQVLSLLQ